MIGGVKVTECPHCKKTSGYYVRTALYGKCEYHYNYDNTSNGDGKNEGIYDNIQHRQGKYKYCDECRKRIGIYTA